MNDVFLIGGGRDPEGVRASHEPFVAACGDGPLLVVCEAEPDRWTQALRAAGAGEVLTVGLGALAAVEVADVAGIYVAGGLTPAYARALKHADLADAIAAADVPYAGFSAGAAVAPAQALVGGWRLDGRQVCDEDAGEELEELTIAPGLGLVPFAVEVHATQWGTLTRLVHAVNAGLVATGVAIDEDTCVQVRDGDLTVHGRGSAYRVGKGTLHVLTA